MNLRWPLRSRGGTLATPALRRKTLINPSESLRRRRHLTSARNRSAHGSNRHRASCPLLKEPACVRRSEPGDSGESDLAPSRARDGTRSAAMNSILPCRARATVDGLEPSKAGRQCWGATTWLRWTLRWLPITSGQASVESSARRRFCGRAASQARCWAGSVRRPTTDRPTCCAALGSAKGLRAASLVGLHSLDELPPAVHAIARHRGTDLATAILEVHHSARRLHSCIVRNGIKI